MKRVYFNLRASSRERMWDTARQAARVCIPQTPPVTQQTSLARQASYRNPTTKYVPKLKHLVRSLPLLNTQAVPHAGEADLLYMWGAFPRSDAVPYVLELDNPFAVTYYNQRAVRWRRQAITRKLRAAACITTISAAARNHVLEVFGTALSGRCHVLPPFMHPHYTDVTPRNDGLTRFLFVGLGFRRKGAPELLSAFSRLANDNARLTVISPVSEAIQRAWAHDTRIAFLPPQPRAVLFRDIYPTHDVFVFPSLLETLGVVILEALSFGMGIITTDVYATPEMVVHGKNGYLLAHPFLSHATLNGVPVIDCVSMPRDIFTRQYITRVPHYDTLAAELENALSAAIQHKDAWRQHSIKHFTANYAPEVWEKRLQAVIAAH